MAQETLPEELIDKHFVNTVAGLKHKARALRAQHYTRSSLQDRPRAGLTATSGAIDEKGGADAPSANAASSHAARRQPIIPRPHPAGSSPWAPRPAPNGKPVASDLARRLQAARLAQRMSLTSLSDALRGAPQPTVLRIDQLSAYEDGSARPSWPILQRLAAALDEPGLLQQISAAPKKRVVHRDASPEPPAEIDRTSSGLDDARTADLELKIEKLRRPVEEPISQGKNQEKLQARQNALQQRAQESIDGYEAELQVASVREFAKEVQQASLSGALTAVRAGHNRIGNVGAALLAARLPPSVTILDLSHNRIASAGLKALCDAACAPGLAAMRVFNFSGNRAAFARGASASSVNGTAKTALNRDLDSAVALHRLLSESTTLRELGLAHCGVTESTLCTVLGQDVDAVPTDGPKTSAAPVFTSSLEVLDLSGNPLGSDMATHLLASTLRSQPSHGSPSISLAKLGKLDMTGVGMGDDGAAVLSDALRDGCALTDLILNSNSIGQNGAAALASAVCKSAPESSSQVTKLSVASNDFGPNGGIAFATTLEQAYSAGIDSWPPLVKLDLSANSLGSAGERGPRPHPLASSQAVTTGSSSGGRSQGKGEIKTKENDGSMSPPASPAASPGRLMVTAGYKCPPSEHRAGPCSAVAVQVSQMTDEDLRKSIELRKRRAAAGRARGAHHPAICRRRQHSTNIVGTRARTKAAWGFNSLSATSTIAPQRLDDSIATLRSDDSRPAGRALNSYAGAAPTNDCDSPPATDFIPALRGAMTALRSASSGQGLRAIKIEGNGLGRHAHELLTATSVTFKRAGTIGLELLPDQATDGKKGIEVRTIARQFPTRITTGEGVGQDAEGFDKVKVGMLLQSVAGVPLEKAAGSTSQRFNQVISMIKGAGRPMTLTFIDPDDRTGYWHRLPDGWITTAEYKCTDPEFQDKFPTAKENEMDAALWQRRHAQVAEGVRVDEARVQRIRHELMARLPPSLGYITPPGTPAVQGSGWARKSLRQLRRREQVLSKHDASIATLEPTLRFEADLIGSGLRSIEDVPLQYAGKVEGPHRGYHHRFVKDQTDQAAEMLLAGVNSTDVAVTQLPPSRFPKGEGGRFNLLDNHARQVAKRIASMEAKAAVAQARKEKGAEQVAESATGLLKWRDPKTGELHEDRN